MLKIKSYQEDAYSFYGDVVSSKRNTTKKPRLKDELEVIGDTQLNCFNVYDENFQINSLINIMPEGYSEINKENLKGLYSYRNKKIQSLKNSLTVHPLYRNSILNICQNCTINEVDTMDHILGQTAFPEFSIHPKNLFPCCSACNKKKSDNYVDEEGNQLFLNLYLDDLPQSQYLHVEFSDNWVPNFFLEKNDDISDELFKLIENHYARLDLLNRFRDSSNEIINTLKSTIKTFNTEDIKKKIAELCLDLEVSLGHNHRQIVIYRALGSSDAFIDECTR
ncbi:TPA: hypothetical protein ACX6QO_000244 [Photobacterium damselae]